MKAVLVHGFNVKDDGASTIDTIKPYLPMEVLEADYGHIGLIGVRFYNDNLARMLSKMTPAGSLGIGHSNGCALLLRAVRRNPKAFKHLILINPALDTDTDFPYSIESIHVIYTDEDIPVRWSKFLFKHEWGAMGRYGYTGVDSRVTNYNATKLIGALGHSDVFIQPDKFYDKIIEPILEDLTNAEKYDIIY